MDFIPLLKHITPNKHVVKPIILIEKIHSDPPFSFFQKMGCNYKAMPIAAHFELHIEQGPLLEAKRQRLGNVEGVQSYRWYSIKVLGRDCHTGTSNFANRSDALLAAAIHSRRLESTCDALASTGILMLKLGSTNTVPGTIQFSLDIRSPKDKVVL